MNDITQLLLAASPTTCTRVRSALSVENTRQYHLTEVNSIQAVTKVLQEKHVELILSELRLTDGTVLDLITRLKNHPLPVSLVTIAETCGEDIAIEGMKQGVHQCLANTDEHMKQLPITIAKLLQQHTQEQQHLFAENQLRTSEERYLDIFDNTNDLIQCLGPDGRFLYTNRAWRETLGYSKDEVASLVLPDILHPESTVCCLDRFKRLKSGETLSKIEFKFFTKTGEIVHLRGDCGSIIKDGEAISTRGIFKNITSEIKTKKALTASEIRYQSLYENSPDMNAIVDKDLHIVSINRIGAELLGYSSVDELIGKPMTETVYPEDRDKVYNHVSMQLTDANNNYEIEYRKLCKNDSVILVHMRSTLVPASKGTDRHLFLVCRDITELRKLSDQLSYQATHDDLTNLFNRREFETRLMRILSAASKDDAHALCFLDLDQFKLINDACGHLAGDELLRQVSKVLAQQIRSRDTLARLGGDEFAVLLEHCDIDEAEQLADRFRKTIEDFRFHCKSRHFSIGVSIGVVPIDSTVTTIEQAMSHADSACYAAKESGRNCVFVYRPDDATMEHYTGEMQWASKITMALEQGKFLLYAQPIYSACQTKKSGRYEILVRLREKSEAVIRPGAFLAAAERFNLSTKLDSWVFESTLDWFTSQPSALNHLDMCAINLSGLSLSDESFLELVDQTLLRTDFPCNKLCFEITETAAISNIARATNFITHLKARGCQFALDDFGSGLSSYGYLKKLPVDVIKIDGIFVQNIEKNEIDQAIVKSICEIATLMGKETTAEYVESKAALEILQSFGVSYVQGNYLGKPMPLADAVALKNSDKKPDIKNAVG